MTVRTLAETGAALGRWDLVDAASLTARLLWRDLRPQGRLLRTRTDGRAKIQAFLEDHAALGNALVSLHGATLDPEWIEGARWCCDEILARFWSEAEGTVYDTPIDGELLVVRPRDPTDGATPSGPSLAAELLLRAGHIFDQPRYREAGLSILRYDAGLIVRFAPSFGRMLAALDRALAPPIEVVVVGDPADPRTRAVSQAVHEPPLPNLSVVGRAPDAVVPDLPLFRDRGPRSEGVTVYVCRSYVCDLPVTSADEVREQLRAALAR